VIEVLKDVRVLEQGTFITGPACGMMLGDLGADVIKVEQPVTGDPFRAFKGGLYSPTTATSAASRSIPSCRPTGNACMRW
jgi:crotonobetainyl-CoA:carnitine CoA-transferase CaiB-like acyl-CoA transferase